MRLGGSRRVPGAPRAGEVLMRVRDVRAGFDEAEVLHGVSLDLVCGEVLALIGPNGAGKSTLLAVISGDLDPTGGAVQIDGAPLRDWSQAERAMRRSVLLQSVDVSFPFRVREVVEMGRAPWAGTGASADDERIVRASLRLTETEEFAERPYTSLSGGERSRSAFARVLAQAAPIMLLDEPTAAMDVRHQEMVMRRAREYAATGAGVVIVVHALDVAAAYADRVALLEAGRVAALGAPSEVLTAGLLSRVYRHPIEVVAHPRTGAPLVVPVRDSSLTEASR